MKQYDSQLQGWSHLTFHQQPYSQLQGWPLRPPCPDEPIARRTRSSTPSVSAPVSSQTHSHVNPPQTTTLGKQALLSKALHVTPAKAAQRKYPPHLLALWCTPHLLALWCTPVDKIACPVYDQDSGDTLEYRQLRCHPKYRDIWEASYANKLGRLC